MNQTSHNPLISPGGAEWDQVNQGECLFYSKIFNWGK